MKIPFQTARFLTSALLENEWPTVKSPRGELLPEMALVGRSNVGKSSLINQLLNQKKVAKISSTPGKTQRMNFFVIDEQLLLVDLPGYGFARAPEEAVKEWSEAMNRYFTTRPSLRLILLLIDSRRGPSAEDLSVYEWAKSRSIPLLAILTKTDKLTPFEVEKAVSLAEPLLGECFPFNIHDSQARRRLIAAIQKRIQ